MREAVSRFETDGLSPFQKKRGRRLFSTFAVLNTFSYLLLSGNIITLYLIRLEASSTFIGVASSFAYISNFLMFIGRALVGRFGVIRTFSLFWFLRYLATVPLLLSPLFVSAGRRDIGFSLILFGLLGFQVFRGIGMVGNNPVLGSLSEGRDRGDFLSKIQIISHTVSIVTGISLALLLGERAPISRYTLFLLSGVVFGLLGCLFLSRLPEPPAQASGAVESFFATARRSLKEPSFLRFLVLFATVTFAVGMCRPFIILYAKRVYALADGVVVVFTVIGSLGAVFMGFSMRILIDRLGAKPMYMLFYALALLSMTPMLVSPDLAGALVFVFLAVVFFLFNFGFSGVESSAQTYFFSLIRSDDQLNLGILYFFVQGLGGTIGSLVGGLTLDLLSSGVGLDGAALFRAFYAMVLGLSLPLLFLMSRLESLGSFSLGASLSVIFSARDLRAIVLMKRLDRASDIAEAKKVIREIAEASSNVSTEVLLERLHSPSFEVRSEALKALEQSPEDRRIVKALMDEVRDYEFTTASTAAHILGVRRAKDALPLLREKLNSEDYLLSAQCMEALARIGDQGDRVRIESILRATDNPHLLVHGVSALRIFGHTRSLPVLFSILARDHAPEYLRDEIILASSGIVGMEAWFYPLYDLYLKNHREGVVWLIDYAAQVKPIGPFSYNMEEITSLGRELLDDQAGFAAFMKNAVLGLEFEIRGADSARRILSASIDDERLLGYERFRFFLFAVFVRFLPR